MSVGRKVHHAYPLATFTDCGREFQGRLVRGDTITARNGCHRILVTNEQSKITCQKCVAVQP